MVFELNGAGRAGGASWDNIAEQTIEVYHKALGTEGGVKS